MSFHLLCNVHVYSHSNWGRQYNIVLFGKVTEHDSYVLEVHANQVLLWV